MTKKPVKMAMAVLLCGLIVFSCALGLQARDHDSSLGEQAAAQSVQVVSVDPALDMGEDFFIGQILPIDNQFLLVLGMRQNTLHAVLCDVESGEKGSVLMLEPVNETELAWYRCGAFQGGWYLSTSQRLIITNELFEIQMQRLFSETGLLIDECVVSPDGKTLAYTDESGLWISDLNFEHKKMVEAYTGQGQEEWTRFVKYPAWSEDGTRLTYEWCGYETLHEIRTADLTGTITCVDVTGDFFTAYQGDDVYRITDDSTMIIANAEQKLSQPLTGYVIYTMETNKTKTEAVLMLYEQETHAAAYAVVDLRTGNVTLRENKTYDTIVMGQGILFQIQSNQTITVVPMQVKQTV